MGVLFAFAAVSHSYGDYSRIFEEEEEKLYLNSIVVLCEESFVGHVFFMSDKHC